MEILKRKQNSFQKPKQNYPKHHNFTPQKFYKDLLKDEKKPRKKLSKKSKRK